MRKIARLLFAAGIVVSTFFSQQAVNAAAKVPRLHVETITELNCGTQSGYVEFTATVSPGLYSNISLEWPEGAITMPSVSKIINYIRPVTSTELITGRIRWTVHPEDSEYSLVVIIALTELRWVHQLGVKIQHDESKFTITCHSSTPDNAWFSNLD